MTENNVTRVFKDFIVDTLLDMKANDSRRHGNAIAQAFYNGNIAILERFNLFLQRQLQSEEELTMEKLKLEFGDLIPLDELPKREKENSLQKAVKEIAPTLKPGTARVVKSATKWGSFSNAVYKLKRDGELDDKIAPKKVGDKFFLIREK